jgi:hypothetical protein
MEWDTVLEEDEEKFGLLEHIWYFIFLNLTSMDIL